MMQHVKEVSRLPLVIICGPTASGKTALALSLAEYFPLEIVSADSRQVYTGMNIGTAKATREEQTLVPHHLLDVVDPDEDFTVADFSRLARAAVEEIWLRGRYPVLVGGTGLYIKVLTEGLADVPAGDETIRNELKAFEVREGEGSLHRRLSQVDPELASRLSPKDQLRIIRGIEVYLQTGHRLSEIQRGHSFPDESYRLLKVGLSPPREELYDIIDRRVEKMIEAGLKEEVEGLLASGFSSDLKAFKTIGYREMVFFLNGEISFDDMLMTMRRETRRYAKRQITWFKKDKTINWLESCAEFDKIAKLIERFHVNT